MNKYALIPMLLITFIWFNLCLTVNQSTPYVIGKSKIISSIISYHYEL